LINLKQTQNGFLKTWQDLAVHFSREIERPMPSHRSSQTCQISTDRHSGKIAHFSPSIGGDK
jgi:hypothetical protein